MNKIELIEIVEGMLAEGKDESQIFYTLQKEHKEFMLNIKRKEFEKFVEDVKASHETLENADPLEKYYAALTRRRAKFVIELVKMLQQVEPESPRHADELIDIVSKLSPSNPNENIPIGRLRMVIEDALQQLPVLTEAAHELGLVNEPTSD